MNVSNMCFQNFIALLTISSCLGNIVPGNIGELHACHDNPALAVEAEGHIPGESVLCQNDLSVPTILITYIENGSQLPKFIPRAPHAAPTFFSKRQAFKKDLGYPSRPPPLSIISALQIADTIIRRC